MNIPVIGISVWLIVKIAIILLMVMYSVFAVIVVKQVRLMIDTLDVGFEAPIKMIAFAHLIFSLGVLGFSFLI